jgi:GDPmannose 4,6-dehydratase
MKQVIIFGASGQDGSYMADYVIKNTDYNVILPLRRQANPNDGNYKHLIGNQRVKIESADLNDFISISGLVKKYNPDYLINFAAQSHVHESWNTPVNTFVTNAVGTLHCLEAIRLYAPNCRFYHAGSSEMWGDVLESPQNEDTEFRPRSVYGASKAAAHYLTKVYRESYNLYAISGILLNHESERRGKNFVTRKITLKVAEIANKIKKGEPFEPLELGNLDAKRDWSHAEDFVDGIWRMLNQELFAPLDLFYNNEKEEKEYYSKNIKEYVLSSNETHTVREFVELAFQEAGIDGYWFNISGAPVDEAYLLSQPGIVTYPIVTKLVKINPQFYRPADVELLLGDSSAIRNDLGWAPKNSFQDLVKRMVKNDLTFYNK